MSKNRRRPHRGRREKKKKAGMLSNIILIVALAVFCVSAFQLVKINFTPSDLSVFSPANERTSYRNFISKLEHDIDVRIDDYKNRDRKTNALKHTIDYSQYSD